MISIIVPVSIFILLSALYFYMLKRMDVLVGKGKIAAPNILRSLAEIVVFLCVYAGCAVIASLPKLDTRLIVTLTILGFFTSLTTFNYRMYKSIGKNAAYISVGVIFCIYVIAFFSF
jgi:hypothetical protein